MTRYLLIFFLLISPAHAFAEGGKILNVETIKSERGIEAWLVQDKTVPVIAITFSFEGGLAIDPDDKPGVGRLVSILLDEGAGEKRSQEFQALLSDNAIRMSFTAGRDAFYGELKTLSSKKDLAFDLLNQALAQPRFDSDAIERMKNANISEIKSNMGDPNWLVSRVTNGMIFEGHTYAKPGYGDLASMQSITRNDLISFAKDQFAKDVLKVSIVGDISKDDAKAGLDNIFGSLPDKADLPDDQSVTLQYPGKTILLPLDTPQTFIAVVEKGRRRSDKDWHAAVVMNYILGGSDFGARLMTEIREKRGLTYGAYSSLNSMKNIGLIQANLSSSNEKAAEALELLKKEWKKMADKGPTEDEVRDAKDYLTGSLLLGLTSTDDVAGVLNGLQRENLDPDYINRQAAALNAINAADVRRAASDILKPDALTTILVGQPKNINADILLDRPPGMREPK